MPKKLLPLFLVCFKLLGSNDKKNVLLARISVLALPTLNVNDLMGHIVKDKKHAVCMTFTIIRYLVFVLPPALFLKESNCLIELFRISKMGCFKFNKCGSPIPMMDLVNLIPLFDRTLLLRLPFMCHNLLYFFMKFEQM